MRASRYRRFFNRILHGEELLATLLTVGDKRKKMIFFFFFFFITIHYVALDEVSSYSSSILLRRGELVNCKKKWKRKEK